MGPPNQNTISVTPTGGATVKQACAACMFHQRRCPPDCLLAPYFPANKNPDFLNVQKLFDVGKLTKILKNLPDHRRDGVVQCIINEANVRAADPVGGCVPLAQALQNNIDMCTAELKLLETKLDACRSMAFSGYNRTTSVQEPMPHPRQEMMGRSFSNYTITGANSIRVSEQGMKSGGGENPDLHCSFAFDRTDPTLSILETNFIALSEQGMRPTVEKGPILIGTDPAVSVQETNFTALSGQANVV